MSLESCAQACGAVEAIALSPGSYDTAECYCLARLPSAPAVAAAACSSACPGDAAQLCGGDSTGGSAVAAAHGGGGSIAVVLSAPAPCTTSPITSPPPPQSPPRHLPAISPPSSLHLFIRGLHQQHIHIPQQVLSNTISM
jgi:hypothetical protein